MSRFTRDNRTLTGCLELTMKMIFIEIGKRKKILQFVNGTILLDDHIAH